MHHQKIIVSLLLITSLCTTFMTGSLTYQIPHKPQSTGGHTNELLTRRIRTEVEGVILHFQENLSWSEERFSEIMNNKEEFKSNWTKNFTEKFGHGKSFEIEFEGKTSSTVLRCSIHGVITKSGDEYTARFSWLLNPLGLDFIDDEFNESKTGLSWKGTIEEVETLIILKFPPRDTPYKAWHHPNGHCHAHVWWKSTEDTTDPSVSITSPSGGETISSSDVTVEWSGDDNVGIDHYEVQIEGGGWTNVGTDTSYTFTGVSDGYHTVVVKAVDEEGNTATDSVSFTVSTEEEGGKEVKGGAAGLPIILLAGISVGVAIAVAAIAVYFLKVRKS